MKDNGNYLIYDGTTIVKGKLNGNGSFDSEECIKYLEQSDIVVTNPPFSLFRKYMLLLLNNNKRFLILGNINAVTCKEISPFIFNKRMWFGYKFNGTYQYLLQDGTLGTVGGPVWFTNLNNTNTNTLLLTQEFKNNTYSKYDNYNAINVNKVKDIPYDYDGAIGVPVSVVKYLHNDGYIHLNTPNKELRYKIIKIRKGNDNKDLVINGKRFYCRILIQNVKYC